MLGKSVSNEKLLEPVGTGLVAYGVSRIALFSVLSFIGLHFEIYHMFSAYSI